MLLSSSLLIECSTYKQSVQLKCTNGLEVCIHIHFCLYLVLCFITALSPKKITVGDEGEIRAVESGKY